MKHHTGEKNQNNKEEVKSIQRNINFSNVGAIILGIVIVGVAILTLGTYFFDWF